MILKISVCYHITTLSSSIWEYEMQVLCMVVCTILCYYHSIDMMMVHPWPIFVLNRYDDGPPMANLRTQEMNFGLHNTFELGVVKHLHFLPTSHAICPARPLSRSFQPAHAPPQMRWPERRSCVQDSYKSAVSTCPSCSLLTQRMPCCRPCPYLQTRFCYC